MCQIIEIAILVQMVLFSDELTAPILQRVESRLEKLHRSPLNPSIQWSCDIEGVSGQPCIVSHDACRSGGFPVCGSCVISKHRFMLRKLTEIFF